MDKQTKKQSPIFSKTFDFLNWLLAHVETFPKSQRFRLAKRIEDSAFLFHDLLIRAVRNQRKKKALLYQADVELDKLRTYFRLARKAGYTNPDQYRHVAGLLTELGKLVGGWLASKEASSSG
ncbi:diversity-generating retroelement protein Avd [Anaerolineales bacterium HSG25]|nr:diversity-generating retroelement protein Avd [Anaerolineales bacterium HSG25]